MAIVDSIRLKNLLKHKDDRIFREVVEGSDYVIRPHTGHLLGLDFEFCSSIEAERLARLLIPALQARHGPVIFKDKIVIRNLPEVLREDYL